MRTSASHSVDAFAAATTTREMRGLRAFSCSFPANAVLPAHAHASPTFFIVTGGGLRERIGRHTLHCDPGSVLLKGADYEHSDVIGEGGLQVVGVEFCDSTPFRDGRAFSADVMWHATGAALLSFAHRMRDELATNDAASELALESVTLDILALHLRAERRTERAEPPWLRQLIARLHDAPLDQLPALSAVAQDAGLHPVYVARAFRRHMGCSLGTYVRRLRLDAAASRLRRGGASVAHIAHAFGFADQSHFARAFRARFGGAPSDYKGIGTRD